jgi:hypothetical protein
MTKQSSIKEEPSVLLDMDKESGVSPVRSYLEPKAENND